MERFLMIIVLLISLIGCDTKNKYFDNEIIVEATYMRYACGDWVDDMQVQSVNDSSFRFLIGKDIDPFVSWRQYELGEWFYKNRTDEFGMTFRIHGFVSVCALSGCEGKTPKFRVTDIYKLNGDKFILR